MALWSTGVGGRGFLFGFLFSTISFLGHFFDVALKNHHQAQDYLVFLCCLLGTLWFFILNVCKRWDVCVSASFCGKSSQTIPCIYMRPYLCSLFYSSIVSSFFSNSLSWSLWFYKSWGWEISAFSYCSFPSVLCWPFWVLYLSICVLELAYQ